MFSSPGTPRKDEIFRVKRRLHSRWCFISARPSVMSRQRHFEAASFRGPPSLRRRHCKAASRHCETVYRHSDATRHCETACHCEAGYSGTLTTIINQGRSNLKTNLTSSNRILNPAVTKFINDLHPDHRVILPLYCQ